MQEIVVVKSINWTKDYKEIIEDTQESISKIITKSSQRVTLVGDVNCREVK